jgi:hypothetical protein
MPSIDQGGRKERALYGLIEVFANGEGWPISLMAYKQKAPLARGFSCIDF